MTPLTSTALLSPDKEHEIELRFQRALSYFRRRGRVVFVSYCRFWERHAQPQQSLAKLLVANGIEVTWLDGQGWRPYRPSISFVSEKLRVKQLVELPGRRIPAVAALSHRLQAAEIRRALGRDGLLWVQGGIDEGLAEILPGIEVFSVFDDPYRHPPDGVLCRKARLVFTQNRYARELLRDLGIKAQTMRPPMDMTPGVFDAGARIELPSGFPERRMGYIGSFFAHDFDLELFEEFVRSFPQWGFLIMGRTDAAGESHLQRLSQYPNFQALPWVPRSQVGAAWKLIELSLLLYRRYRPQDGAFPTKILESLHFGVPAIATSMPKTADLEGLFPRSSFVDKLKLQVEDALGLGPERLSEIRAQLAYEMSPKLHLARVAEWLDGA